MLGKEIEKIPELLRIKNASSYFSFLLTNSDHVQWLWDKKQLWRRYPVTELYRELKGICSQCENFVHLQKVFRQFKQRHFLRIGGRDLLKMADLRETLSQLSDVAAAALQVGVELLFDHPWYWADADKAKTWEELRSQQRLAVMGLGKLGGQELNYVSDIDLVYMQKSSDRSKNFNGQGPALQKICCQYLTRLFRDQIHGDIVFHVDLRLRPHGKDGDLVPSLDAAVDHYQNHGQAWERQALLKARPVAGDRSLGNAFLQEVRPFVFRRFLDFQALDELRIMRDRILSEAITSQKQKQFDVKLGIGGIRELEFIVQSFQLIYGGRYPELDEPSTLRCLQQLQNLGLLPEETAEDLTSAYEFLRNVEHWIQLDHNRHTQRLPSSKEALNRLAENLGFSKDKDLFENKLQEHCRLVHDHFLALFQSTDKNRSRKIPSSEDLEQVSDLTEKNDLQGIEPLLDHFSAKASTAIGRTAVRFSRLTNSHISSQALTRLQRYLQQLLHRPGLQKMIDACPKWLEGLLQAVAQSGFVGELLIKQPSLVEGLNEAEELHQKHITWQERAERIIEGSTVFEESLEWIRRLKNERVLMLALADLQGKISLQELLEELSCLADMVIHWSYKKICTYLGHDSEELPLAILAMGKLGSRELGYFSDLDLMFVYEPRPKEESNYIPVDIIKLIQRLIRALSIPLHEGPGYQVDAQLRPTGNYGPLAVTLQSWQDYYNREADLWEIQTLLRARAVSGHRKLGKSLQKYAHKICYRKRRPDKVWPRLCHLRSRMEKERAQEKESEVNIKLGYGGIADLEFLYQGHQLLYGYQNELLRSSNPVEILGASLHYQDVSQDRIEQLQQNFLLYRLLEQRLQLHRNLASSLFTEKQFRELQDLGLWSERLSHGHLENWSDLMAQRRRVRAVWEKTCRT